jgi:hypothetical protein
MSNLSNEAELIVLKEEIEDTQNRFFIFIEKLENRIKEFATDSIPELTALNNDKTDNYRQSFYRMKAAVDGQFVTIRKKASEVFDDKVSYYKDTTTSKEQRDLFYAFRNDCRERITAFEDLYDNYKAQVDATDFHDYEIDYQNIVSEFNEIKDSFKCVQCSSPIVIDKLYFTTTYLNCSSCDTQNTFEPSTQAKQLEHIGRSLAEQRTAHLLAEYNEAPNKETALFTQKRELTQSLIGETNQTIIAEKTAIIQQLESQQQIIKDNIPNLYKTYLRAMFDQWNLINPAMKEEHEKFYKRLIINK